MNLAGVCPWWLHRADALWRGDQRFGLADGETSDGLIWVLVGGACPPFPAITGCA